MRYTNSESSNQSNNDLKWHCLAEYSLNGGSLNQNNKAGTGVGLFDQRFQEFGLPQENIAKIDRIVTRIVNGSQSQFDNGNPDLPVCIRLLVERKILQRTKQSKRQGEEQTLKSNKDPYDSDTCLTGGWGYFLINRYERSPASIPKCSNIIELYLYREGEPRN